MGHSNAFHASHILTVNWLALQCCFGFCTPEQAIGLDFHTLSMRTVPAALNLGVGSNLSGCQSSMRGGGGGLFAPGRKARTTVSWILRLLDGVRVCITGSGHLIHRHIVITERWHCNLDRSAGCPTKPNRGLQPNTASAASLKQTQVKIGYSSHPSLSSTHLSGNASLRHHMSL